ncbi:MetQ/NlpA family ABC transporter substrate-binding protein [Anoxynatronum sibiricum]|uniref:Lipoprotein n=1 Tax=Anoxynatronum sibiricum TaxID=210623 RepID=A0ABU9VTT4_9CLOT
MKKIQLTLIALALLLLLAGCGNTDAAVTPLDPQHLTVGVTAGPHEEILEKVKEIAARDGVEIDIQVFTEYVMPNIALAEGELDINSFQHQPYLDNFKSERNLELVDVASTVIFPMGIYAAEYSDVSHIQQGDLIGLPNDPTNGARALILFESAGLITLKEGVGVAATVNDIAANPLDLRFIELEASQIPRQLDELAAAAINANFAIEHGYVPTEDTIFIEPGDSPWVNVIAVRTGHENDEAVKRFIEYYHLDEVRQFIGEHFQGSIVAAW